VLMFGMGRPVLAVDTHVRRVSIRLGLIPNATLDAAHDLLAEIVASDIVYEFHVNMVRHGREVCHARKPACGACVLRSECDFYVRQGQADR
jgi:endonuclease III